MRKKCDCYGGSKNVEAVGKSAPRQICVSGNGGEFWAEMAARGWQGCRAGGGGELKQKRRQNDERTNAPRGKKNSVFANSSFKKSPLFISVVNLSPFDLFFFIQAFDVWSHCCFECYLGSLKRISNKACT